MNHDAPMPGSGTLATVNEIGASVGASQGGAALTTNFAPTLSGNRLRLSFGAVDGFEPTIGKLAMSTTALTLQPSEVDELGRSWACLEVEPNADGTLHADSRMEIIQTKDPTFFTPTLGRKAIALILFAKGKNGLRPVRVQQLVKFSLAYRQIKEGSAGPDFKRHVLL